MNPSPGQQFSLKVETALDRPKIHPPDEVQGRFFEFSRPKMPAESVRDGYGARPAARPLACSPRSSAPPANISKLRSHSPTPPLAVGGCQRRRRWFRAEWVRWSTAAKRFWLVTGDPLRRWPGTKRRKGRVNDRFATGNGPPRPRHRAYERRPVPSWCLAKKDGW